MTIQVEFWALVSLFITFLGFMFGIGRLLLSQFDQRMDERFNAIEKASAGWQNMERDFLKFQADLPLHYVRREDYVRNQTVIEAKLDAVALKIENMQLKEAQR